MSRKNLKWDHELDLRDLWEGYDDNSKTIAEIASGICKRLRSHAPAAEFEDVADEMENLAETYDGVSEGDAEFEDAQGDFNSCMSQLYDVADYDKQCWVRTTD